MSDLSIAIFLAVALSGVLLWLLRSRQQPAAISRPSAASIKESTLLTAKHYRYFPLIRQALCPDDTRYMLGAAPPGVAQRVVRERRAVARRFLKGLREDFLNLARLGRMIASLSPVVSREQETERLILSLKFQMLYAFVWLRLSFGNLPLQQLEHLTGLVGRLAVRMEEAMAEINAASAGQLPGGLGA